MVFFGLGMTGLATSIGGLFATDIAPKRVAGAALGVIGIFSYIGSAAQEQTSGWLIERGITSVHGILHYDFTAAIHFWIGASVVSMLLALALWKTGNRALRVG